MNSFHSLMLYQDEPDIGFFLKVIIVMVPVALLAACVLLLLSGESTGGLVLFVEALVVSFIFWVLLPRRYQVYENHVRIVLGGPFSVKVGFDGIKTITVTTRQTLTVNFATKMTNSYVVIVKKRGLSIAITPRANDLFVEQANRAFSQWTRASGNLRPNKK
jgi:hypothetical protein